MINIASIPGTDPIKLYTLIFVQCLQYLEHEFGSELSSRSSITDATALSIESGQVTDLCMQGMLTC